MAELSTNKGNNDVSFVSTRSILFAFGGRDDGMEEEEEDSVLEEKADNETEDDRRRLVVTRRVRVEAPVLLISV